MKRDQQYWIKQWEKNRIFRVENDRLKPKSYLLSSFPKTNIYGFQNGNIRNILVGDAISRFQRMAGYNVLYPIGFDSLGYTSFVENKKHSNTINDDISMIFERQMEQLGIGIDQKNKIDLKHDNYLSALQLAFIELYEKEYIVYDDIEVYQDVKRKKIYDSEYANPNLSKTRKKAFYLDIKNIQSDIEKKINELNTTKEIRQRLLNMLKPETSITIDFSLTNGGKLSYTFKHPEYLGGISFISIHPDYYNIDEYCQYEEFRAIEIYLTNPLDNDFGVFSGNYAINPLTGKKIPVFVSVKYNIPLYIANPYLNPEDRKTASEECLSIIDVVQNGVFIESDFLNGVSEAKGKELILKKFMDAEMGKINYYYSKEKILLTSLDAYGALFPFLIDGDNNIHSLKKHLPFVFSTKFRPELPNDIDVPGNVMDGSINHIFSTGMIPLLSILYDEFGASLSLFSDEAVAIFNEWQGLDLLAIYENELFEYVFIPTVFLTIIQNEKKVPIEPLFKELILIKQTYNSSYQLMNRMNNNLLPISKFIDEYHGDTLRLYLLSKQLDQDFIFTEEELESINNLLINIEQYFEKDMLVFGHSNEIKEFCIKMKDLLFAKKLDIYVANLLDFYKKFLYSNEISQSDCILILKLIYPICPFLAEDIYKEKFNGKYLISDDGWLI